MVQVHLGCVHLHFNYKLQRGCIYSLIYLQVGCLDILRWQVEPGVMKCYSGWSNPGLVVAAAIRSALLSLPGSWLPCLWWASRSGWSGMFVSLMAVIWSNSPTVLPEPPLLCFALALVRIRAPLQATSSPWFRLAHLFCGEIKQPLYGLLLNEFFFLVSGLLFIVIESPSRCSSAFWCLHAHVHYFYSQLFMREHFSVVHLLNHYISDVCPGYLSLVFTPWPSCFVCAINCNLVNWW